MRKNHWKAVAVAAVLMMTLPALLALAADKAEKAKPAGKTTEQMMPGCTMHGGAEKDAEASMPGCGMKGGKGACSKSCDMKACGMKGGKAKGGCGKSCDMKACAVKGGKEMTVCVVAGDEMKGCATKGGKGMSCSTHDSDLKGCGTKGEKRVTVRVVKGGPDQGMPGCGMKGPMGPGMADGPKCGPMLKGLDLTAEQQKKVDVIHEKQARLMVQAQADLRIAEMDMQQLMRSETPDKAKIDAQIDKLAQLRAGMQKSRTATLLEVRALLTPEQLKKCQAGPMGDGEEDD
jgi:Spy/CpxP family protein refolding chaperone